MKTILYILVFIIFFQFTSCVKKVNIQVIKDLSFERKLEKYINEFPITSDMINLPHGKIAYPSYHAFFNILDRDTIITFKLLPHLTSFNILEISDSTHSDDFIHKENADIKFFLFKKHPVIIIDPNKLSKNIIDVKKLIKEIPDSLKYDLDKISSHIKSKIVSYKFNKGEYKLYVQSHHDTNL
ncbi:hypothetical protein [Tenacibaculum sp. IB213877]|uniref:hypothetical protein n=1 Tax=Tenacibaculum sp. IB213877 TaxID=3097351 RepID=UPI002A5AE0A2|nr:hypothetical protein [Tenacibaculum sp. IB213877]MDY0780750.1 hypothetical protein [Tenacibaculum sp. IB213877]